MAVDEVKVTELTHALLDAVHKVDDYTVSELLSAALTFAKQLISAVIEKRPEAAPLCANAVQQLLMECVDPNKPGN